MTHATQPTRTDVAIVGANPAGMARIRRHLLSSFTPSISSTNKSSNYADSIPPVSARNRLGLSGVALEVPFRRRHSVISQMLDITAV